MRRISLSHALPLVLAICPSVAADDAQTFSLNGTWTRWTPDDGPSSVEVPFSRPPIDGTTLYIREFEVPAGLCEDFVLLRIDAVVGSATVFLNGVELGTHGSFTPFWFDVSSVFNPAIENVLILAIDDGIREDTVPGGTAWIHYTGIIQDVYLECSAGAVLLSSEPQYDVVADLTRVEGEISVRTAGPPGTHVSVAGTLFDQPGGAGEVVAQLGPSSPVTIDSDGIAEVALSFAFDNVELWSPDGPRLYSLRTTALVGGSVVDERLCSLGFRQIRRDGTEILLNGQPLFLKGIGRHDIYHESGFVGTEGQMVADMMMIKSSGANYVRLLHYPHHPRIYELADELGLLVSSEPPAWVEFDDPVVVEEVQVLVEEMVRRDMHHPSIALWILGNHPGAPLAYAQQTAEMVRDLDRTRLISFALDNSDFSPETMEVEGNFVRDSGLDLFMKNVYWPFYLEETQDAFELLPPDLAFVFSEFGYEGTDRTPLVESNDGPVWVSELQQAAVIAEAFASWRTRTPFYDVESTLRGMTVFNFQDVPWPELPDILPGHVPSLHYGLTYLDRTPKLAMQAVTDFYTGLPDGFVGLPSPDESTVDEVFAEPFNALSPQNTDAREAGPALHSGGNRLYFATETDSKPTLVESVRVNGAWQDPAPVDLPADANHDAIRFAPSIGDDEATLYFTRALVPDQFFCLDPRPFYLTDVRIMVSHFEDDAWQPPIDLGNVVNHPAPQIVTRDPEISSDGETLYFSSNRPGGHGKLDLWTARRTVGAWKQPSNLGSIVNSPFDDCGPTMTGDGRTLYFSSDRPGEFGLHDLWVTRLIDGVWSEPKNLGPRFNSAGDEREPSVSRDGTRLHFRGVRAGGLGFSDLWMADFNCAVMDTDGDEAVGLGEFGFFHSCVTEEFPGRDCSAVDANRDGIIDLRDFARLQSCIVPAGD